MKFIRNFLLGLATVVLVLGAADWWRAPAGFGPVPTGTVKVRVRPASSESRSSSPANLSVRSDNAAEIIPSMSAEELEEVVRAECSIDPGRALNRVQQMNPGSVRDRLLQEVAGEWVRTDPAAALGWLQTAADSKGREAFAAAGAKALAATDPDLAAELLVSTVSPGDLRDATALSIADQWVARSPTKAADWAARLPEGTMRAAVVDLVSHRWLQSQPMVAYVWVKSLPEMDGILAGLDPSQ